MLSGLDLFSGIGGISVALRPWVRPMAYCEKDKYCQGVLLSRMRDCQLERAPIWDDVSTLQGDQFETPIDIIYGGFPCQDISVAGRGEGLEGKRSGLFFEIMRLASELKPTFLFFENVPAIRTRGMGLVAEQLASLRYDCRWGVLSAQDVGALHLRERWFCLAYSSSNAHCVRVRNGGEWDPQGNSEASDQSEHDGVQKFVADTHGKGSQGSQSLRPQSEISGFASDSWGEAFATVHRTVDGLSSRVDRIRSLGNAVVPQQVREAFKRLMGLSPC